jgi:iduronate 2-sulfatase
VEGRSFAGVLGNVELSHRDHVTHVYPRSVPDRGNVLGRAIRTERYRLVEWKPPGAAGGAAELELYDYLDDPQESRNLVQEQPEVVKTLQEILDSYPQAKPPLRAEKSAAGKAGAGGSGASRDRNTMFDRRDMNRDGKLSREEFLANQTEADKAPARFTKMDRDEDGSLSREEFVGTGSK